MIIPPRATLNDLDVSRMAVESASLLANTIRLHRNTPIEQLGTEALRFLLEENESLPILLRVAVDRLEADPLLGGDYHPGDLLVAVLTRSSAIFLALPELRARAYLISRDVLEILDTLEPADREAVARAIRDFQQACLSQPIRG